MITTPERVLDALSRRLNESTTDTSAIRVGIFNDALHHILSQYKMEWARKLSNLSVTVGTQEYDLTSEISDYDPTWGIYSVEVGGQVFPVEYEDRTFFVSQHFTLEPNKKKIIFTKDFEEDTTVPIWYYARHTDVSTYQTTLSISLPESILNPLVLYMKHLVHDGKRQRNDARNAILDFAEVMEQVALQNASSKAKNQTTVRRNPLQFAGFKRTYANH